MSKVEIEISVQCATQLLLNKAEKMKWLPKAQNADICCLVSTALKNNNNGKQNTRIRYQ